MAGSFLDLRLAFEFVSSGGMGENKAYLDRGEIAEANEPRRPPVTSYCVVLGGHTPAITCWNARRGLLAEITKRAANPAAEVPTWGGQIRIEDPDRRHA